MSGKEKTKKPKATGGGVEDDPELSWLKPKIWLRPDDQVELVQDELKEEYPRVLVTKGYRGPLNLVEFSYRENRWVKTPLKPPTVEKINIDGKKIYKYSPEGRAQMLYNLGNLPAEPVVRHEVNLEEDDEGDDVSRVTALDDAEEEAPPAEEEKEKEEEAPPPPPPEEEPEEEELEDEEDELEDEEDEGPRQPEMSELEVPVFVEKKVQNEFNFCQREAMTYNNPFRDKCLQTTPPCRIPFSDQIEQWVIFDGYEEDQLEVQRLKDLDAKKEFVKHAHTAPKMTEKQLREKHEMELLMKTEQAAKTIERMINQNTYDDIAQDYRYWDDPCDQFQPEGTMLPLWKLVYEKTKKLMVTSICWNPCYYDYFAVAFGTFEFTTPVAEGSVCLFSLKNPSFPEFICFIESGVMCVDIHPMHPDLIALGLYDGNIAVYNVQLSREPQLSSDWIAGKHETIIWQIKWMHDTPDDEVNFYSISSDGDVCNWLIMKEGLVKTTVIRLYVPGPPVPGPYHTEVRRTRCGSYITFHPVDRDIFLAGSEEGYIHKCTVMYSDVPLFIYESHLLPVHRVDYNKFYPAIFISCSADWTIKIWEDMRSEPLFAFDVGALVGDVEWAPFSSTVFAACTQDGKVHIFDLNIDKYKAICVQCVVSRKKHRLTRLAFNHKLPFLVVGDDKGCTTSLKLSPNLRKKVKPPKKGPKYTPSELEVLKLERILANVREPVVLKHPVDAGRPAW